MFLKGKAVLDYHNCDNYMIITLEVHLKSKPVMMCCITSICLYASLHMQRVLQTLELPINACIAHQCLHCSLMLDLA